MLICDWQRLSKGVKVECQPRCKLNVNMIGYNQLTCTHAIFTVGSCV